MQLGDDTWHTRIEKFVRDVKQDGRLLNAARRNKLEAILVRN